MNKMRRIRPTKDELWTLLLVTVLLTFTCLACTCGTFVPPEPLEAEYQPHPEYPNLNYNECGESLQ